MKLTIKDHKETKRAKLIRLSSAMTNLKRAQKYLGENFKEIDSLIIVIAQVKADIVGYL